jgi:hypothetical protein
MSLRAMGRSEKNSRYNGDFATPPAPIRSLLERSTHYGHNRSGPLSEPGCARVSAYAEGKGNAMLDALRHKGDFQIE